MNVMEDVKPGINVGRRSIERIDSRLLVGKPTYLFNIYSNQYTINLGTCGIWLIPACPEGEDYICAPKAVPGTVVDTYPHYTEGEEFRSRAIPGEDIVKAILGTDRPQEDITALGIFASQNEEPKKHELEAAKRKLVPTLQKQLALADQLAASSKAQDRESVYDDKFFRAARYLNVKKPWMSEAAEMTQCQFCMSAVSPKAVICGSCKEIINPEAYAAMKKAAV
jgi:hypothetical protein